MPHPKVQIDPALLAQPGVKYTGGGVVYNPNARHNQWENRWDNAGNQYNARITTPLHPNHANAASRAAAARWTNQINNARDTQGENFTPGYVRPTPPASPEVVAAMASDDAFLKQQNAGLQINPETDDVVLRENLERAGLPTEQFNQVTPPSPVEDLERFGQPQENLDRQAYVQQVTPPPLDETMYNRDYQVGLQRYRQLYAPRPTFDESLRDYLLSQGVDRQRAEYEVNRQAGLRRFNQFYR